MVDRQLTLPDGTQVLPDPDGAELRYSEDAVQDVLDFFSLIPFGSNEWAGKPFKLLPWELDAIREFYGVQVRDDDGRWVRYRRFLYTSSPARRSTRRSTSRRSITLSRIAWEIWR